MNNEMARRISRTIVDTIRQAFDSVHENTFPGVRNQLLVWENLSFDMEAMLDWQVEGITYGWTCIQDGSDPE